MIKIFVVWILRRCDQFVVQVGIHEHEGPIHVLKITDHDDSIIMTNRILFRRKMHFDRSGTGLFEKSETLLQQGAHLILKSVRFWTFSRKSVRFWTFD